MTNENSTAGSESSCKRLLCPICGAAFEGSSGAESRLSIHVLYGHTSEEYYAAVEAGTLLLDEDKRRFTLPGHNPAFEPTAARPGPSVGSKGNVGLREMDT